MSITDIGVNNPVFVKIVLLLIFAAGGASFLSLPRYIDPDVNINTVVVLTVNPGMAPEDIETLITQKIEDEVIDLEDIDRIMSISREGASVVNIEFYQSVKDMNYKVTKVQNAVNRITDLPEDVEMPRVYEITTSFFPICEIAFSAPLPEKTLKELTKRLSDRIEDIHSVGSVNIFGDRERQIRVDVDRQRLEAYGLSLQNVCDAVRTRSRNVPGGVMDIGQQRFNLRVIGEAEKPEQLGEIALHSLPDGGTVYLSDVASIQDSHEDEWVRVREGGRPCMLLQVKRKKGADTIKILQEIKSLMRDFQSQMGSGIHLTLFTDTSKEIENRISDLQKNAFYGLCIVFLLLAYSLGARNAVFATLGIPVSFLSTFAYMHWANLSLDGVSLFALILVLGIVVDDAIIVLENIRRRMEQGLPARQAAIVGAKEVILPVTAATFTTVAAFAPLLLVTGIIGKFIQEIPLVVIFTLMASLFEAFFMMPSHVAEYGSIPRRGIDRDYRRDLFAWLRPKLGRSLFYVLRRRYTVVPILLLLLSIGSYVSWKILQVEMFPNSDAFPRFDVKIWLQDGTRLDESERALKEIEAIVRRILPAEILDTTIAIAGMVEVEYRNEFAPHVGTLEVLLRDNYKQTTSIPELIEKVRPLLGGVKGLRSFQIDRKKEGPPTGAPVYIDVRGEKWENLEAVARRLKERLASIEGVYDIRDDYSRSRRELWAQTDEAKSQLLGVNNGLLADTVNAAVQGRKAAVFHDKGDEFDIVVRLREEDRSSIDALRDIKIKTPYGGYVTVGDAASLKFLPGFYTIPHTDGKRTISITAQLDSKKTTSQTVNAQIQRLIPQFLESYPECQIAFSGEYLRNQEVFRSLFLCFLLGIFLIYLILATQFHSFMQPLIIMLVIPFASVGVFGGLLLTLNRLTFPAMIGIVALAGIVVNDSLVLVEFVNRHRKSGLSLYYAIISASKVRLRPIILTSITTIGGLAPMALGLGGKSPLWSPLANAIIFGLTTSTLLTLFIIPLVYAIAEDIKLFCRKKWMQIYSIIKNKSK
ncbi:MAG: efflux RND transporter permease subunit [Candidatus Omnitrophota bacterium]